MKKIVDFNDLDVYQRSYKISLILITKVLPKLPTAEKFDLIDQLKRSSKAIPRLIAEGYGKRHQRKGFQKYLDDAISETNETVVGLQYIIDLYSDLVNKDSVKKLMEEYRITGKQLYRLRQAWDKVTKP